jgi:hypothetical protein
VHEGALDDRKIARTFDTGQPQQVAQPAAMRLASQNRS